MKRILASLLTLLILISFTSCGGNYAQTDLKDPIAIGESGIIEKSIFDQAKRDNAVVIFTGKDGDIKYEWKVFGNELTHTRDVNLSLNIEKTQNGVKLRFAESQALGFDTMLSVYLNEKWSEDGAAAYAKGREVYPVTLTGSKTTVLNISVNDIVGECEILPENVRTEESKESDAREYSDGNAVEQDQYKTDPVPEGKPMPVEPEDQEINSEKTYTCTFSIECSTILNNLSDLEEDKIELVSSDGVILEPTEVTFYEGETVFDVLVRICKEKEIHLEYSWTPMYNSAYIEGINNLYEFDCGELSGWTYRVDGWYPNYGCSRYQLAQGERVEWRYTCDLGRDVGGGWTEQ